MATILRIIIGKKKVTITKQNMSNMITGYTSTGVCSDWLSGLGTKETLASKVKYNNTGCFYWFQCCWGSVPFSRAIQALSLDMWLWDSYLVTLVCLLCKNKMRQLGFMFSGPSGSKLCDCQMSSAEQCLFLILRQGVKVSEGQAGMQVLVPCCLQTVWVRRLGLVISALQWSCHLWFIHLRKWILWCTGNTSGSWYVSFNWWINAYNLGVLESINRLFPFRSIVYPLLMGNGMYQRKELPKKYTIHQLQPMCLPIFSYQLVLKSYRCITGDGDSSAQVQPLLFSLPLF